MSVTDTQAQATLVARTKPQEANSFVGQFYFEFRVRELSPDGWEELHNSG